MTTSDNKGGTTNNKEGNSQNLRELSFEEAFELTGNGKINYIVLFTSGLIILNVSMESFGISYILTVAECDLGLTNLQKRLVSSATFIGIMTTSLLWGYLGDRFGRRKVMLPAIIASIVVSLSSSFAKTPIQLVVLRILTGSLVSASSATIYAYLGEMHKTSQRAAAIAWGSAFISISFILLPAFAWIIVPCKWSTVSPWRVYIWTWCVPGIISAIILIFLPESPRYLLVAKGPQAALKVLEEMYSWNKGKQESYPVGKIILSSEARTGGFAGAAKNFGYLFKPPLLRCVIITHIAMFSVFMVSSGIYVWVPDILNDILQNSKTTISICQIIYEQVILDATTSVEDHCSAKVSMNVFPISMSMGAVFGVVYLSIGVFINRLGKRIMYSIIMLISAVSLILAAFVPQRYFAMVFLILALAAGCAASIIAAIAVDIFPTCLRAMAMCVLYMMGRAGAAFGAFVLGVTLDRNCHFILTLFGVFSALTAIIFLLWPNPKEVRQKMESKGLTF